MAEEKARVQKMQKLVVAVLVLIVVIAGGIALTRPAHKKAPAPKKFQDSIPKLDRSPAALAGPQNLIIIRSSGLLPNDQTIKKGSAVWWGNQDKVSHTISESDGQPGPRSGTLKTGATYYYVYNKTGTFKYRVDLSSHTSGSITVTN